MSLKFDANDNPIYYLDEEEMRNPSTEPVVFVKHEEDKGEPPFYYLIPLSEKENFEKACRLWDEKQDSSEINRFSRWNVDGLMSLRVQLFVDSGQYAFEYCEEGDV